MRSSPTSPELRHRGLLSIEAPPPELWEELGGTPGVVGLVEDHYRRMSEDALLRHVFPHFRPELATEFFVQWFGGDRDYADGLEGGLVRRHQHRFIPPTAASAWLRCLREALLTRGVEPEPVLCVLGPTVHAMTHSSDDPLCQLARSCDGIQDPTQVRLRALLHDAARGWIDKVREALAADRTLARKRGLEGQILAWVATYKGRSEILELALAAGADPNAPACDPLRTPMACDDVHLGTAVSVTPLALARKWRPKLILRFYRRQGDAGAVRCLLAHGATSL